MLEEDEDTHLCIKCNTTIVGLDNYIRHRKNPCGKNDVSAETALNREIIDTNHSYRSYEFNEPPSVKHEKQFNFNYGIESTVVHHTEHDDVVPSTSILPSPMHQSEKVNDFKTDPNKSLSDSYDYSYGLGADVFFSSLNLQSSSKLKTPQNVSTNVSAEVATTSLVKSTDKLLQRKQSDPGSLAHGEQIDDWINTGASTSGTDKLMKAVDSISGTKKPAYDSYNYEYDDDDDDEMVEVEDLVEDDVPPLTGGKWKPSERNHHHSMHSASRWYERWDIPEENNQLGLTSATASSSHEDLAESYPPPSHTRGKWVPGTKIIKLDYKHKARHDSETFSEQFWCNYCNRKLSSRVVYERHLLSKLHTKRSQPESELEQAQLPLPSIEEIVEKKWSLATDKSSTRQKRKRKDDIEFIEEQPSFELSPPKKRKRRFNYIKCGVCNTRLKTALYGKHLISHYHYRRMFKKPTESYATILENIHRIVLQSPYQCHPCRFYANTEEMFLRHWCSDGHLQVVSTSGQFWCAFCKFNCETNDDMRRHLISKVHQEVVNAINRSVPIIIRKKSIISCDKCSKEFTLNIELRKHALYCSTKALGTASNQYQGKYYCASCNEHFQSIISFQRHAATIHSKKSYFCGPCELSFTELEAAKRHRVSAEHKVKAARITAKKSLARKCTVCGAMQDDVLVLKQHLKEVHPEHSYSCYFCGQKFILPQELSRHIRDKVCKTTEKYQNEEACNDDDNDEDAESFSEISLLELPIITDMAQDVEVPKLIDTSHNEATTSSSSVNADTNNDAVAAAAADAVDSLTEENYMIIEHDSELSLEVSTQSKTEQNDSPGTVQSILWGCKQCDFRTPTEAECIFHEMLHKWEICNDNKIPCPICNRTFGKNSLRCHLRLHTNERIFKCDHCEMNFTRKANLKDHIQRIHLKKVIAKKPTVKRSTTQKSSTSTKADDEPLFGCSLCDRQFRKKRLLDQHMHCHREMIVVRAFDCPEKDCLFRGRSVAELRVHQTTHSSEKNFSCTMPNCSYKTKTNALLKRHIKSQHQNTTTQYKCTHCEFSTKISSHLKRHNRIHSGSKPFKCPHCSYVSNNLENLRKHVIKSNKHPGRFLYECKLCTNEAQPFATNTSKEYKIHLVTVHKEKNNVQINT